MSENNTSPSPHKMALLQDMQHIFQELCTLPVGDDLAVVRQQLSATSGKLKDAILLEQISAEETRQIHSLVKHIHLLASAAMRKEEASARSRQLMQEQLQTYLQTVPQKEMCQDEDTINYDPWRQWFSDHVTHPYYDNRERDRLMKQIPGMTPQKMQTWFVNVRRRSGWSELYRKHADNKRENMEAIFAACESEDGTNDEDGYKVAPEARKLVEKIKAYLTLESKKTEIAPWLADVLNKYKQRSSSTPLQAANTSSKSSSTPNGARRSNKRKTSDNEDMDYTMTTPIKRTKSASSYTPQDTPSSCASSPLSSLSSASTSPAQLHAQTFSATSTSTTPEAFYQTKAGSPELHSSLSMHGTPAHAQVSYYAQDVTPYSSSSGPGYTLHQAQIYPQHVQALHNGQQYNGITYNMAPAMYGYTSSPAQMMPQFSTSWGTPQWSSPQQAQQPFLVDSNGQYYQAHPQQQQLQVIKLPPMPAPLPSPSAYAAFSNLASTLPSKKRKMEVYVNEDSVEDMLDNNYVKRGRPSVAESICSESDMTENTYEVDYNSFVHQGIPIQPLSYAHPNDYTYGTYTMAH